MYATSLLPFVQDREVVRGLLLSAPTPLRKPRSLPVFPPDMKYRFTPDDVAEFVAAKRPDVAEFVLSASPDVDLLTEVAKGPLSIPLARGLCRNPNVPVAVLLQVSNDARSTVAGFARAAVASRLDVPVRDVTAPLRWLRQAFACPAEDLRGVLGQSPPNLAVRGRLAAFRMVLERPDRLPPDAVEWLYGQAAPVSGYAADRLLAGLVSQGYVARPALDEIVSGRVGRPFTMPLAVQALLSQWDELSPELQTRVLQLSMSLLIGRSAPWPPRLRTVAAGLSAEQAVELFALPGVARLVASCCPALPGEVVAAWAEEFANSAVLGQSPSSDEPVWLLGHPAVSSDVAQRVIHRRLSIPRVPECLAVNPNLTVEQQQFLQHFDEGQRSCEVLPHLLSSATVSAMVLREFVDITVAIGSARMSAGFHAFTSQEGTLLCAVLDNPVTPQSVRESIPAWCVASQSSWLRPVDGEGFAGLEVLLRAAFGSDVSLWREFLLLMPQWEGSLGDLVSAVRTL